MAQQSTGKNNSSGQKRGPGRPPGSRNKSKTGTAASSKQSSGQSSGRASSQSSYSGGPTKQEVLHEMQRRSDRERRNNDIIWSITLFAIGLFLFFTVVMDTTGSFGMRIHDIFNGLFGIMAFVLPFFVFVFAILLLAGKLQHIGARTAVFSILIFINMCILNSYRFIDPKDLHFGFSDILDYFVAGIDGEQGGAIGMELGSLLVKFFGMPGLLIISITVIVISIFLVANTPISRFAEDLSRKHAQKKMLKELEEDEQRRLSDEEYERALGSTSLAAGQGSSLSGRDAGSSGAAAAGKAPAVKSWFSSFVDSIMGRESDDGSLHQVPARPSQADAAAAASDIPEPFSRRSSSQGSTIMGGTAYDGATFSGASDQAAQTSSAAAASSASDIEYTQIIPNPSAGVNRVIGRGTLFGKIRDYFSTPAQSDVRVGIDSETGENVTKGSLAASANKNSGRTGMDGREAGQNSSAGIYAESRDFEKDETDYGYPGRKKSKPLSNRQGYGLGDPDEIIHSGSYGLDAHGGSSASGRSTTGSSSGRGVSASSKAAGAAAGASAAAGTVAAAVSAASAAVPSSDEGISAEKKRSRSSSPGRAAGSVKAPSAEMTAAEQAEDEQLAAGFSAASEDGNYEFPPVSLLKKDTGAKQMMSNVQLEEKANLLEQTLNNFGVDATVINVTQGASVTRYEVQPAVGVKVSKITSLADDIALNLRAKSIRIEAPIPGKAAVGIEVENNKPAPVLIRELIDSDEFRDAKSKISFVVGKDISGNNIIADLKDMPHMLIAGATGSGKSVCINSIITSFLYKAKPSELKLIMVDPKVVELGNYNGIPHMLTPVVTDPRKASRALAIAVEEMDKRYETFAENNVRDLESYNELMRANHRFADCKPQIVIIIDELADLMMAAPKEVESSICRLAQKARAAGMHLIVATQRPSVDVVTGLIKANIPSRIAFSVASQFDSRTILDMQGAENLLGKGDMLFSPVGATKPYRVQGPYISDQEITKVIKFVKSEGGSPSYDEELKNAIENPDSKRNSEPQDELTEDAIAFILKNKQASVSMLQRRFRIGYNRAARIIDEIEEKGIIGPSDGSKPRQLLMTEDEYYGRFSKAGDAGAEAGSSAASGSSGAAAKTSAASSDNSAAGESSQSDASASSAKEPDPDPAYEKSGRAAAGSGKYSELSNTQALNSFNSLPESVRRAVMDSDSISD